MRDCVAQGGWSGFAPTGHGTGFFVQIASPVHPLQMQGERALGNSSISTEAGSYKRKRPRRGEFKEPS